jgi:tetratricopeptide (TPR) repeat protein
MMLFGMGKIYAQMAARDNAPQAVRKSLTMYRSAVVAHPQNHLAANEAGVLLARAGRYPQSLEMLEHSLKLANASATHRNLAYVQAKLNHPELAQMHEQTAMQLAQHEISRGQFSAERGIQWVSPDEFNRMGSDAPGGSVASAPNATQQSPATQTASPQQSRPQSTWW